MTALLHPRPAALLQSAQSRYVSSEKARRPGIRPAFTSLLTPLLVSGLLMALVVPAVQLSLLGPVDNFASLWLENWLVTWAFAFPVVYLAAPALVRLARFVSAPVQAADVWEAGLAFTDIAAVAARATEQHGFKVLRNLKVQEDFYRA